MSSIIELANYVIDGVSHCSKMDVILVLLIGLTVFSFVGFRMPQVKKELSLKVGCDEFESHKKFCEAVFTQRFNAIEEKLDLLHEDVRYLKNNGVGRRLP